MEVAIMTLVELQKILGDQITQVTSKNLSKEDHAEAIKTAESVAKLAKQMINNADVVLRADKIIADGTVQNTTIEKMVK